MSREPYPPLGPSTLRIRPATRIGRQRNRPATSTRLQQELSHGEPGDPRLEEDLEKWPEYAGYVADDDELDDEENESKSAAN